MKKWTILILIFYSIFPTFSFCQIGIDWVQTFNGPTYSYDFLRAFKTDSLSNIYLTGNVGEKCATVKFSSLGEEQWVKYYQNEDSSKFYSHAIDFDSYGNVIIAGLQSEIGFDFIPVVIKYNTNGEQIWAKEFFIRCAQYYPQNLFVKTDHQNNLLLVGTVWDTFHYSSHCFVLKLDSMGIPLWFNEDNVGFVRATTIDSEGAIYITGGYEEIRTVKFDAYGNIKWQKIFGDSAGVKIDIPSAIALDNDNNTIVVGVSGNSGSIIKYDSSGVLIWHKEFDESRFKALTCDSSNNVFIAGSNYPDIDKIITIKYNSLGEIVWTNIFQPPSYNFSEGQFISLNNNNTIWVSGMVGFTVAHETIYDLITIEYDQFGENKRSDIYDEGGFPENGLVDMMIDNNSKVIVGATRGENPYDLFEYFLVKYNPVILNVENLELSYIHSFFLSQNYPNPFNPITNIHFAIASRQFVTLKVYDVLGKEVVTLVNEEKPAGSYEVEFNPESSIKNPASGIYFYQLKAGDFIETKKMILLK